jgi:CheY-like chemotaxis protein
LMDIQMPGMDGFEAIDRIRQIPEFTEIPIVALTALAMPDDCQKCLDAGANRYVSKPVKLSQLITTIETLLAVTSPS